MNLGSFLQLAVASCASFLPSALSKRDLMSVFLNGERTTNRHLFSTRLSDDSITV